MNQRHKYRPFYFFIIIHSLLFNATIHSEEKALSQTEIYQKVASKGNAATVAITCKTSEYSSYYGTGVIISSDGYVLSSSTVIPKNAKDIFVWMEKGKKLKAKLIELNDKLESVLLKVDSKEDLPHVPVSLKMPSIGERAYSFGNPHNTMLNGVSASFSVGVISGIFHVKSIDSQSSYNGLAIETDAAINPGQDGGPLLNCYGQLIGISSLSYGKNRWLGVSVPIKFILNELEHFKQKKVKLSYDKLIKPGNYDSRLARGLSGHARALQKYLIEIDVIRQYPPQYLKRLTYDEYLKTVPDFDKFSLQKKRNYTGNFYQTDHILAINQYIRRPAGKVTGLMISEDGLILTSAFNLGHDTLWLHKKKGLITHEFVPNIQSQLNINQQDYKIDLNMVKEVYVTDKNGKRLRAKILAKHRTLGIALLKVDLKNQVYFDLKKKVGKAEVGDPCAVIGTSSCKLGYTFNSGMISANNRNRGQHIQVDAAVNFGNSGGPVFDKNGDLLGIALEPIRPTPVMGRLFSEAALMRWQIAPNSGVSFVAKTDIILKYLPKMMKGEDIQTYTGAYMGLAPDKKSLLDKQVVISVVADDSPAENAGIEAGDIIAEFDNKKVESWNDIIKSLDRYNPGDKIKVLVKRKRPRLELNEVEVQDGADLEKLFKVLKDGQSLTGRYVEYDKLELTMVLGTRK